MSRVVDVDSLLAALRISAVRRAGSVVWACCPVHIERTPSFFIRDDVTSSFHGASHCYGCGGSWFPPQLVQQLLGFKTQREAFEWLRTMPQIEQPIPRTVEVSSLPVFGKRLAQPREVEVPERAADWPERYLDYLRDRRVTDHQIEFWGLGFVPLRSSSELADRVYIPACDAGGRLLSYTCRAVGKGARRRYREPRREEGASAAAVFGELVWPALPKDVVLVTEGAFNAMAVERALPRPAAVAALMGSSLAPTQVLKLAGFARAVLLTDPDEAGDKAADALAGALGRYTQVRRVRLPEGQDCDSLPPDELRGILSAAL